MIDQLRDFTESHGEINDIGKKEVLHQIIERIILDHDPQKRVHYLDVHFRIPMVFEDTKKGRTLSTRILKNPVKTTSKRPNHTSPGLHYSTVTDFARFRGWSTLQPRITAMW